LPDRRGVLDLSTDPPEILALDTSVVAVVLFRDQPAHAAYAAFLLRAVAAGTTLAYGELLDLELAQVCMRYAREQHGGDRERFVPAGRKLIAEVFASWRELYSQTRSLRVPLGPWERPDMIGSPVREAAFRLMARYGLDSYDATHAATALVLGAPLLTADKGFAYVPESQLTLITHAPDAKAFRAVRAREGDIP